MDWKLAVSTFGLVSPAEFGDKSRLAALLVATLLGVLLGSALREWIPERKMSLAAAILFIVVGAWLLARVLLSSPEGAP